MGLGQREQVLDGYHLAPLELGRVDSEAALQLWDYAKSVGIAVGLQIPAEANATSEVAAWPERDLFEESVDCFIGVDRRHEPSWGGESAVENLA
jgi:hypothetical protein